MFDDLAGIAQSLLHFGGGTIRDYSPESGQRLPTASVPGGMRHLRYYFSPGAAREALCRHADPRQLVDAAEWWNLKVGLRAATLCHEPHTIERAVAACTDLWGRAT